MPYAPDWAALAEAYVSHRRQATGRAALEKSAGPADWIAGKIGAGVAHGSASVGKLVQKGLEKGVTGVIHHPWLAATAGVGGYGGYKVLKGGVQGAAIPEPNRFTPQIQAPVRQGGW